MQDSQSSSGVPESEGKSRGNFILGLGILALALAPINCAIVGGYPGENIEAQLLIFCLGLVLGIVAWVMANSALRKIRDGVILVSAHNAKAARMFAIAATILHPALAFLVVFVAIFASARLAPGKDSIINDLGNYFASAYQYRIRPLSMKGGGGSYTGYEIPGHMSKNENGRYTATVLHTDTVQFHAKWLDDTTATISVKIGPEGRPNAKSWIYSGTFKD